MNTRTENKYTYRRFISGRVLDGLIRPQLPAECSVNSIAGAINALTGNQCKREDIYNNTSLEIANVTNGGIGNDEFIGAVIEFAKANQLKIAAESLWEDKLPVYNNNLWRLLQKFIRDPHNVLILHKDGHYNLIAGFFEEPWEFNDMGKEDFESRRDWLFIADHSISRGNGMPVYMERWKDVYKELGLKKYYSIIKISIRV